MRNLKTEGLKIWAPPESPLRVEYSSTLLREVRKSVENNGKYDDQGILFGVCKGQTVRVISIRERAKLEPVGIFRSRIRGEVFLSEEDLESFEKSSSNVALVIAGPKAGFFVRDAQGSIETIRSYLEFPSNPFAHEYRSAAQAPVERKMWKPVLAVFSCLALAGFVLFFSQPFCPLLYRPSPPRPLDLTLQEEAGQLQIFWNAAAVSPQAALTIIDGDKRITVALSHQQSSATYVRHTDDVHVELAGAHARFLGRSPPSR